jgi:hypothetical protein
MEEYIMKRMRNTLNFWSAALFALALLPALVRAQGIEVEPNDPCSSAQDFGDTGLPYDVSGLLDLYDVDFFRFQAVAGEGIIVDLEGSSTGQGTLYDPLLGLFDSSCNLIESSSGVGVVSYPRLYFTVPADGAFVLAASACCDWDFDGTHSDYGTYTMTIAKAAELSSISGRVVDAVTGDPLPDAYVELLQYDEYGLEANTVSWQWTDTEGEFLFDSTSWGDPLVSWGYRLVVSATDYETDSTTSFFLLEGDELDIGDIALNRPPVRFSDIVPCAVPAVGGECEYSVRITNTEPAPLRGAAWSLVKADLTGSYLGHTEFQAEGLERLWLETGASTEVEFEFDVPGTVPQGTYICPDVWVGIGVREPYFFTVGEKDPLFCIYKGIADSFTVFTGAEAEGIARQLDAQRSPKRPGSGR